MPNDPKAHLLMICTGTGSAPFRAFTMRRQRNGADASATMTLVFGARAPGELPYFGPLDKVPDSLLHKHLAFSRVPGAPSRYVQDQLTRRARGDRRSARRSQRLYLHLRPARMEQGVEKALTSISRERRVCDGARCATPCARKAATTSRPTDARGAARNYSAWRDQVGTSLRGAQRRSDPSLAGRCWIASLALAMTA